MTRKLVKTSLLIILFYAESNRLGSLVFIRRGLCPTVVCNGLMMIKQYDSRLRDLKGKLHNIVHIVHSACYLANCHLKPNETSDKHTHVFIHLDIEQMFVTDNTDNI